MSEVENLTLTAEGRALFEEMRALVQWWPLQIEGAVDYACGRPREANPYEVESEARQAWFDGWDDAFSLFPADRLAREYVRWHPLGEPPL